MENSVKSHREQFGHIGVLMGGCSSEREISLKSGRAVFEALKQSGHQVTALDILSEREDDIVSQLKGAKIEVAFIALHGRFGEDGGIQSLLEKFNIPYTGSRVKASRIAINKALTQNMLSENGILVPAYRLIKRGDRVDQADLADWLKNFPVVVKPVRQGSSIGITIIEKENDLLSAFRKAWEYDDEILVEQYIKGKELTVGIVDKTSLPVIEIRPKNKFFDYASKYQSGMTEYIIPAEISDGIAMTVQKIAFQTHAVLGCCDFSRVDVMLNQDNKPYVIEINTIPGFTATSLLPKAAKAYGMDFAQLCRKLITLAYRKQKKPQTSFVA